MGDIILLSSSLSSEGLIRRLLKSSWLDRVMDLKRPVSTAGDEVESEPGTETGTLCPLRELRLLRNLRPLL